MVTSRPNPHPARVAPPTPVLADTCTRTTSAPDFLSRGPIASSSTLSHVSGAPGTGVTGAKQALTKAYIRQTTSRSLKRVDKSRSKRRRRRWFPRRSARSRVQLTVYPCFLSLPSPALSSPWFLFLSVFHLDFLCFPLIPPLSHRCYRFCPSSPTFCTHTTHTRTRARRRRTGTQPRLLPQQRGV